MRVLHINARYWPYSGGSERHLAEISERLVRDGHEVTVYTTDAFDIELFWAAGRERVPLATEIHKGVQIRRFPVRHLPWPKWSFPGVRFGMTLLSGLPFDTTPILWPLSRLAPLVPGLGKELSRTSERFDVINCMNICFEGLLEPARALARRTGAGLIVTPLTHLSEHDDDRVSRYYTMRHQIELEKTADAVLAQTRLEIDYLAQRGVCRDRLIEAGVGVNPAEVTGGDAAAFRAKYGIRAPFVFYAGTSAFDKGTVHLIEAMRRLWARGEAADLVLAGQSLEQFRHYHAALPPEERHRCHLLGFISEEDKRGLFAAGTVFAMPSRTDSFGIVYLEAWLNEKPVIGALAGGVPDIVDDGINGYLVGFGDVGALADRLARLLASPALANELGQRGRDKVLARYTWDIVYPKILEVYERLWQAKRQTAKQAL